MVAKSIKTSEVFIVPAEFADYTNKGYVIFMSQPTAFGTYKAVKIEVVATESACLKIGVAQGSRPKLSKPLVGFWNMISTRA